MKICKRCDNQKAPDDFYACSSNKDGRASWCKSCVFSYQRERRNQPKRECETKKCRRCLLMKVSSEFSRNSQSPDGFGYSCKSCIRDDSQQRRLKNPAQYWTIEALHHAKQRSRRDGYPFSIVLEDVANALTRANGHCRVAGCGRAFVFSNNQRKGDSPSLDKIRPERGYIAGNIQVICYDCNGLKGGATLEQMRWFLSVMERVA